MMHPLCTDTPIAVLVECMDLLEGFVVGARLGMEKKNTACTWPSRPASSQLGRVCGMKRERRRPVDGETSEQEEPIELRLASLKY
eukprot:400979-Pleurochrysis_carterae.AAC.1